MGPRGTSRLERSPIHLLHRATQAVEEIFHAEVGDAHLTPRQLAVLLTVAGNAGASQTALGEITGIDRSTLADIVKRLAKRGLLQRRRTRHDARAYAVKLTEDGRNALRAVGPVAKKVDRRIADALGDGNDEFLGGLQAMIARLTASANA